LRFSVKAAGFLAGLHNTIPGRLASTPKARLSGVRRQTSGVRVGPAKGMGVIAGVFPKHWSLMKD